MARPNRVQPDGSLATAPLRGQFMGNRGCLHDAQGVITRRFQGTRWITCTLAEKPARCKVALDQPGRYTPLFFADEAVACAAGHRPCAECRKAVYRDFGAAWGRAFGSLPKAFEMDRVLHAARLDGRKAQRHFVAAADDLPDGAFILWQDRAHLIQQRVVVPYDAAGYGAPVPRPCGEVQVMTPAPLVAVMRAGWQPVMAARLDRPDW
ncbi:MAG: hypothetical protein H7245_16215 [Candidatus Saccharibacteria bacterium]|nr:hypothetical protein [Pseudorhodobacter sp.]